MKNQEKKLKAGIRLKARQAAKRYFITRIRMEDYIKQRTILDKETGCLDWKCSKDKDGYGKAWHKGKYWRAHRLSYTAFKGDIPEDKVVMHTCDNPSCCNPQHLRIGTHKDNMEDRDQKGRGTKGRTIPKLQGHTNTRGTNHGNSKLSEHDVSTIRDLLSNSNYTQKQIGEMFGVRQSTIHKINTGKRWRHL
jgi:hypothetical protein